MDKKQFLYQAIICAAIGMVAGVVAFQAASGSWSLPFRLPFIKSDVTKPPVAKEVIRDVVREESQVIDVVKKVGPSVVSIGISRRVLNPFEAFPKATTQESGIGTGFIIAADGIIVTNRHVVEDDKATYTVVTKDNKKLSIAKIYRDPAVDFAIIKVDASGLVPVQLADSDGVQVGQSVVAIGNALGRYDNTVTTGVVSGLGRGIEAGDTFSGNFEKLENVIQTDAAINPGNSGGPLLDLSGRVIGINTAIASAQNIGFAIPINTVNPTIDSFLKTGKISRPFLGVRYLQVTRDVALLNDIPQGAYVQEVMAGSPAEKVGIRDSDVITKFEGTIIDEKNPLSKLIGQKKVGDTVRLTIFRDSKTFDVSVTLDENSGG